MEAKKQDNGTLYCRPELRRKPLLQRTSDKLCACGFKRHSKNHAEGRHHCLTKKNFVKP
jgi:hypothetical protein